MDDLVAILLLREYKLVDEMLTLLIALQSIVSQFKENKIKQSGVGVITGEVRIQEIL